MGSLHQSKIVRIGVNMSSGEIFLILLLISGGVGQRGYKSRRENRWMETPECDVIIRDLKREITSPRYPKEYPPFSDCHYTILPSNEAICQVSIHFIDFDVEESPSCFKDKLLVGDEPFCGRIRNYRTNRNLTGELKLRFVSDSAKNGRFRLKVEQIHCGNTLKYTGQPNGECCQREYGEPYFVLTSPGFLTAEWTKSNCRYTIHPSSERVCKLRFRFKHFWVGDEDVYRGCLNGFVEIDKRKFCGCMDGYEYVSNFDETGRKEVWYSSEGPGNRGFVIEVFQEECPFRNNTEHDPNTEIEVFMTNMTSEKAVSRFIIPRDDFRCRDWGHPKWTQTVMSLIASAPCGSVTASQFYPEEPSPFPPPAEPVFPPDIFPPPAGPFFPPADVFAPPPAFYPPNNCINFWGYTGRITSPYYPERYPPNLRLCYRFHARPGHCRLRLKFLDFNLEKSFKCWKDYLLIYGRYRYCGNYFHKTEAVFDFDPYNHFFSMDFVSDWCFSGRGYSIMYTQLPCSLPFAKLSLAQRMNTSELIADSN